MKSPVVKRSVNIAGHNTSVSLEEEFWKELKQIARARSLTLGELIETVDHQRSQSNLSSALRLYVLKYYRDGPE
jgi:predicted DNA-binding ribbon-helix-helix protein